MNKFIEIKKIQVKNNYEIYEIIKITILKLIFEILNFNLFRNILERYKKTSSLLHHQ